jgi:hypothetical protein
MKRITLTLAAFMVAIGTNGQIREIVYSNPNDSMANYYIAYRPTGHVNGLLLLLTSFGETPQNASNETDLHIAANSKGFVTVYASLQYGTMTFFIDSLSQTALDKLIPELQEKYGTKEKPFYLGGFSLGGSGVVKYAERAYSVGNLPRPKAIFAIDPPLDFERFYLSLEKTVRHSKVENAKREADYFVKRLQYEFQSTPQINREPFERISPFSYSDTLQTNLLSLINCPILLISEPDIIWQMEERNRNLYDLNTIDCSAVINSLRLLGNKNAILTITNGKGYRKLNGNRNPHSWSIADSEQTLRWLFAN